MPEPTTAAAASLAATLSASTLALLGVDYHALIWGLAGSLFALSQIDQPSGKPRTRTGAVALVVVSTLAGAALGGALASLIGEGKTHWLVASAFLVAAGGTVVVGEGVQSLVAVLRKLGGRS